VDGWTVPPSVIPALRAEFGMLVWWHVPAVHAVSGRKIVFIEPGMEALYPSAEEWLVIDRQDDSKRRNRYARDAEYVERMERAAMRDIPGCQIVKPDAKWPKKRFIPEPHVTQDISCDIVVCPRKRQYGSEKNWEHWPELTLRLRAKGYDVFAGGAPDSSYDVDCEKAWDYDRPLDATIEAMLSADLVVATDAGLAHLAVLCGRPLLMITHANGIVAPGPVTDEHGTVMEPEYWPVKIERYREANHTHSPIRLLHDSWYSTEPVLSAVQNMVPC